MSIFRKSLDEITGEDLSELVNQETEESIRLEFKRDLNIAAREDKAEAAKDVSAMANTAGGRILYGIAEKKLADGPSVAAQIAPLTDGDVASRLENVLLSSIHPRPRFRVRQVPVDSGFVLVVEIYPAYSGDLYMVTAFNESRFYRRGELRTILMSEPEIREAYARIAASRQALEASIQAAVSEELALVPNYQESVMVIPWYGHPGRVDPRQFGADLGGVLANEVLESADWFHVAAEVKIVADGYRGHLPEHEPLVDCKAYASVRRTGLVHFAHALAFETKEHRQIRDAVLALDTIGATILTARHVLNEAGYWGPVRVIHRWQNREHFNLYDPICAPDAWRLMEYTRITPDEYEHVLPEVNLREHDDSLRPILAELLDKLFQTAGEVRCPWFDESRHLTDTARTKLERNSPQLCKMLAG